MTEDQLEQEALAWLADVGYQHVYGPDLAPDGPAAERTDYRQVLLLDRLRRAVADVYFAKEVLPGSTPVTLGDVLAPPAAELLAGGAPTSVVVTAAASAHTAVVTIARRSWLDDELNKQHLLL